MGVAGFGVGVGAVALPDVIKHSDGSQTPSSMVYCANLQALVVLFVHDILALLRTSC